MSHCSCCCYDVNSHKDFIRGGVNIDDFDKEVNYQTRVAGRKGKKEKKVKTRPGCPENNYGPHVYVWTSEFITEKDCFFYRVYGWHKWEEKICAGCRKAYRKTRKTERYAKVKERKYAKAYGDGSSVPRGKPVSRTLSYRYRKPNFDYWCWEEYDEAFIAAKEEYIKKRNTDWSARVFTNTTWFHKNWY